MSTIIERIKELCSQMRMSENKFASEIGVNTQTLNNYTTGKRSVSYDVVDKILVHFPQVSAEWLIRGIGNMLNGCGCSDVTDEEIFGGSHDKGSEDVKDERIKLLEDRIAFLEEQVDFYKNRKQ